MKVFSEGSFLGNFGIEQFAYAFEVLKCFSILSHFSQALGNLKKKKKRQGVYVSIHVQHVLLISWIPVRVYKIFVLLNALLVCLCTV